MTATIACAQGNYRNYTFETASGTIREVGPGRQYENLGDVPFETLQAGDLVRIHWREEPYREKLLISGVGTEENPIVITGVPNDAGELPVISGDGATTRSQLTFANQDRGVITIEGPAKPRWIIIANLAVRDGKPGYFFTDSSGAQKEYRTNAAAINLIRGEDIKILNCDITNSGNGLFVASYWEPDCDSGWCGNDAYISKNILVEGCRLYLNSFAGNNRNHNIYSEALNITFQYNWIGGVVEGANGNGLKDRSAGTVIRYNWIVANRPIDLVESEFPQLIDSPEYREAHVYGNVIIKTPGVANDRIVHYGGDNGDETFYRKGVLYFYNNTVIAVRDDSCLFGLETDDESAEVWNNILWADPAIAETFHIIDGQGSANLHNNWISEFYTAKQSPGGVVTEEGTVAGSDPGFLNAAEQDYRLAENSAARGIAVPTPVSDTHPVLFQYVPERKMTDRTHATDAGAFGPTISPEFESRFGPIELLDNAWTESDVFGYFYNRYYPWLYHWAHGWWYLADGESDWVWVYDMAANLWMGSSTQIYPLLWCDEEGWLYYSHGTGEGRWFYSYEESSWKQLG